MLLGAILALALPFWHPHPTQPPPAPPPPRGGLEALTREVGRRCPAAEPQLREARPARLLSLAESFRSQLSGPARARLDERLGRAGDRQVDAYLSGLRESGLDGAFALWVCTHARRLR